jgi:hypothetical protein
MSARISLSEAIERINLKHNGSIEILKYNGIRKIARFKCKLCGNEWEILSFKVINGDSKCKKCHKYFRNNGVKRIIFDEAKSEIEKTNEYKVISNKYENKNRKINILFPCGHINFLSLTEFKRDFKCGKCRKENLYTYRYSESYLIELLEANNFEFLEFENEYINGSSIITYKCELGHITKREVKNLIKFTTCKQCKIIARGIMQTGSGGPSWKGGVSKIWVAARARLDPWLDASLKAGNRTCCITGQTNVPIDVHHITSFNIILKQAMNEFGFEENYYEKSYAECNAEGFLKRVVEINNSFGYGACMRKDIHILYHKIYKHGNNTPAQFEEFKSRIQSGEIVISQ